MFRMPHKPTLSSGLTLAFALASVALFGGCVKVETRELDERAVRAAAAEFYVALNYLFTGDAGPMKEVWSHADDVTYMGPGGGFQVGWHAISREWDSQAALKLGGTVKSADMQVTATRTLAVVSNYELGENTNVDGGVRKVTLRATSMFRKEGRTWKMIGHHTDLLPFLQQQVEPQTVTTSAE
jgi:ketosteroid isomerase-like protein